LPASSADLDLHGVRPVSPEERGVPLPGLEVEVGEPLSDVAAVADHRPTNAVPVLERVTQSEPAVGNPALRRVDAVGFAGLASDALRDRVEGEGGRGFQLAQAILRRLDHRVAAHEREPAGDRLPVVR